MSKLFIKLTDEDTKQPVFVEADKITCIRPFTSYSRDSEKVVSIVIFGMSSGEETSTVVTESSEYIFALLPNATLVEN